MIDLSNYRRAIIFFDNICFEDVLCLTDISTECKYQNVNGHRVYLGLYYNDFNFLIKKNENFIPYDKFIGINNFNLKIFYSYGLANFWGCSPVSIEEEEEFINYTLKPGFIQFDDSENYLQEFKILTVRKRLKK